MDRYDLLWFLNMSKKVAWPSMAAEWPKFLRPKGNLVGPGRRELPIKNSLAFSSLHYVTMKLTQENFIARNSILSEYGVLGFELGYSYENPRALAARLSRGQCLTCLGTSWHLALVVSCGLTCSHVEDCGSILQRSSE